MLRYLLLLFSLKLITSFMVVVNLLL